MELADPRGSYAVLIGSSRFDDPDLEDLPGVAGNLRDLGRLLEDPTVWGLPAEHCVRIADPSSHEVVLDAVHEAARRATDSLLVYYAGHGLPGPDGDGLLLALRASDPERPYSWLDYRGVRREVLGAGRKVNRAVILDCCYSGQALEGGMSGPVTLAEQARISGTYLLTSTSANGMALAPPGEPHTAFTGRLIRLLDRGLPGAGPLLSGPDLYDHLLGELRSGLLPIPQQRLSNTGRTFAFARNRHGMRSPLARTAPASPVRAVPEGLREMLRAQPRRIAEQAARLRDEAPATAGELLMLAAATRPAQEAAALVCLLRGQGRSDEASSVLATVGAGRSPVDLAACVQALHAMDADDDADRLLRTIAERRLPEDIAGTIGCLRADGGGAAAGTGVGPGSGSGAGAGAGADAGLLLESVIRRLRTTEEVLELADALWSAQLDDDARQVLRAPSVSSPRETVRLAEALHACGRVEEALALYVRVFTVSSPEPSVLVGILRVAEEAGRAAEADRVLETVAQATPSVQGIADACDALWAAGMADRAGRTLALSVGRLTTADLMVLADLLHAGSHTEAVLQLFGHAAPDRPVADTAVLVAALRTMGRPLDANRLLQEAAARPAEDVAELLGSLGGAGSARDRERVWNAVPDAVVDRLRLLCLLRTARLPYEDLLDSMVRVLPEAEYAGELSTLRGLSEDEAADLLLHGLVRTAPERVARLLRRADGGGLDLLDRTVLRALLEETGDPAGDSVAGVADGVIELLVTGKGLTVDERGTAIAALCLAGLAPRVEEWLAQATLHIPRADTVQLLDRLQERGLAAAAQTVVRGAAWMYPELYRDFVLAIVHAGLRDLAVYALECYPRQFGPADRQLLAERVGVPVPGPADGPVAGPPRPARFRDRLRRR
ncbi:caspase family protein [Streptomyces sp. NPDC089799]|uniref:caspase, EACC1-associated type n=1 Tax=Streptomyces sp. NPDC089799 TaxID=3155066 RepID=UPI0034248DF3